MEEKEGFWILEEALFFAGQAMERRIELSGAAVDPFLLATRNALWALHARERDRNTELAKNWLSSTKPGLLSYAQCVTQPPKQRVTP